VVTAAELEIYHSREIAPTRRVALGRTDLPVDPPPGFGGILLGGVVAAYITDIDPDLHPDLLRLTVQLEEGHRIPQPRLRYRFQTDHVGLLRSHFRLIAHDEDLSFDFSHRGAAAQAVLGAVYAAGQVDHAIRNVVMSTIRRAMRWVGPVGPELIAHLTGYGGGRYSVAAFGDPVSWALDALGFDSPPEPRRNGHSAPNGRRSAPGLPAPVDVQRRFRERLREAHPDHGGQTAGAAQRIAELTEARRILLGR
jgi:hypothetical protein